MNDPYVVVGAGAIGGTLAAHLHRAGHPVHLVDADAEHVASIRARGLRLERPGGDDIVAVLPADTPDTGPDQVGRVLLAVKAQATAAALEWITPRLSTDGYVVSLQNGLNESAIADAVGPARTVGAFVNLFADVVEPGVIRDGGRGALVVGEVDGAPSARVEDLVTDLQAWGPAAATANVAGYLWSKLAFGAMLTTTALADAPMAELIDRHRGLMHAVAREVLAVAAARGVTPEPFDRWSPADYAPGRPEADADAATDRLIAWLATMGKDRSGIWRDIAVRHRPVEVHHHYAPVLRDASALGVPAPLLRAVLARLSEVGTGVVAMSESHLKELV